MVSVVVFFTFFMATFAVFAAAFGRGSATARRAGCQSACVALLGVRIAACVGSFDLTAARTERRIDAGLDRTAAGRAFGQFAVLAFFGVFSAAYVGSFDLTASSAEDDCVGSCSSAVGAASRIAFSIAGRFRGVFKRTTGFRLAADCPKSDECDEE